MKKNRKINIVTLGCSKNTVDSEWLYTKLKANQIEAVFDANDTSAKTVIINTCGFIHDAKEESVDTILQFVQAKKRGDIEHLYVMGCLSERYKKELPQILPEVDVFFGVNHINEIIKTIASQWKIKISRTTKPEKNNSRILSTPPHYAYLKIAEGCNRNCAFCIIPAIRGKFVSTPVKSLVKEAKNLTIKGVKEINMIAQDTTYYGIDTSGKSLLPELLRQLAIHSGATWLRLHYTYPGLITKQLIQIIKQHPNICNYIDIPIQHISSNMLKRMQRGYTKEDIFSMVDQIRKQIPQVALRTTILTGYPGESQNDFDELVSGIQQLHFDRLGVFTYSHEEGTNSYKKFTDDIPDTEKERRRKILMDIQERIALEKNKQLIGSTQKIIIDREESNTFIGRTEFDSPEVDNEVIVTKTDKTLATGEFAEVSIIGADSYELYGQY